MLPSPPPADFQAAVWESHGEKWLEGLVTLPLKVKIYCRMNAPLQTYPNRHCINKGNSNFISN